MAEDDLLGAEQLHEIVRGQADAALRQIEAEFVPHRPAQPGIDSRRRRPDALDQPAEDDPVGLRQSRFQRTIDLQVNIGLFRPPHHAVAERGLEYVGVIAGLDHQAGLRPGSQKIIEAGR